MGRKFVVVLFIGIIVIGAFGTGIWFWLNDANNHVKIVKLLPDPFIFNNGSRVQSIREWEFRRVEIKEVLADIEYGHMPPAPVS